MAIESFRRHLPSFDDNHAVVAYISDWLDTEGVQVVGGMLSAAWKWPREGASLITARLVLLDEPGDPRPTRQYPSVRLEERWLRRDELLSYIETVTSESDWFPKGCHRPSAEHVYTTGTLHSTSGWPETVMRWTSSAGAASPEFLPAVAPGLPPFRTWAEAASAWVIGKEVTYGADIPHRAELLLTMPDRRARVTAIETTDAHLIVNAHVRESPEDWELHFAFSRGRRSVERGAVPIEPDGRVTLDRIEGASQFDAFLVHRHHGLVAHAVFVGRTLQPEEDKESAVADIRNGENDRVEFKPFLRRESDKVHEVIKTIIAFSNTYGGRIFVGVTDEGRPEGRLALQRAYKGELSTALDEIKSALKKLARERIKPVPEIVVEDLELGGEPILIIEVPVGGYVYATHENDVWVRKGATNRRPDPAEYSALVSERRSGGAQGGVDDEVW
jgi:hypothetical protein